MILKEQKKKGQKMNSDPGSNEETTRRYPPSPLSKEALAAMIDWATASVGSRTDADLIGIIRQGDKHILRLIDEVRRLENALYKAETEGKEKSHKIPLKPLVVPYTYAQVIHRVYALGGSLIRIRQQETIPPQIQITEDGLLRLVNPPGGGVLKTGHIAVSYKGRSFQIHILFNKKSIRVFEILGALYGGEPLSRTYAASQLRHEIETQEDGHVE